MNGTAAGTLQRKQKIVATQFQWNLFSEPQGVIYIFKAELSWMMMKLGNCGMTRTLDFLESNELLS